jgi:peptide-methionine (S)-S-oxide reductase
MLGIFAANRCNLLSYVLLSLMAACSSKDTRSMNQSPNAPTVSPAAKEVITLGGGCFWCIEAVFNELQGVEVVESGYSGGTVAHPTYRQVCTGSTAHAEVVQITFDPETISLKEILEVFFTVHDPTTLNRQGPDTGTQYRSVIFYRDQSQKSTAEEVIREIENSRLWNSPLLTELTPFSIYYRAEDYHQEYYKTNPEQMYCRLLISPKITKFREHYRAKLKKH